MKKGALLIISVLLCMLNLRAAEVLLETESFTQKGGWAVDQQFMDLMGSPYLIAHGMGVPVADASTMIEVQRKVSIQSMCEPTTGPHLGMKEKAQGVSSCLSMAVK